MFIIEKEETLKRDIKEDLEKYFSELNSDESLYMTSLINEVLGELYVKYVRTEDLIGDNL